MKRYLLSKTLVIGVIILFVGASVVSAINSSVESSNVIDEIGNLNRGTETFYPTDDTEIMHQYPNSNYGSHQNINTQNEYGGGGSPGWAVDGLIRFDISSMPSGSVVEYAVLSLYYHDWDVTNPVGRNINLFRVTSDWDEMSVTWNTQPSYVPQPTTFATVPGSYGWMEWDVTSDVQDFISGNEVDYGWKITDDTYWGAPNIPQTRWRAKESRDTIPYLEIEVLEPHMAFLFGRIENLNAEGDLTTFNAVRLRYLQFSPFSFNTYASGEEIAVVGSGLGIITTSFAFGFFSAALL